MVRRRLILVVIFVTKLKRMLLEFVLLGEDNMICHQVNKACINVFRFSDRILKIETLNVRKATHEDIIETSVYVRVVS